MIYLVARFVHFLGLATLFGAFALQQRAVLRLRRATSIDEGRLWLGLLLPTRSMFFAGVVMAFASGAYLGRAFAVPWVIVGVVTLTLMGLLFALGPGQRLKTISRAFDTSPTTALSLAAARAPWVILAQINGAAIGLLWVMVSKPSAMECVATLTIGVSVATLVALLAFRPRVASTTV